MGDYVKFAVAAACAMVAGAVAAQERTQVGQLTCDISGGIGLVFGSQRTLNCTFTPSDAGSAEFYAGTLTKLGVDIGLTDRGAMVWLGVSNRTIALQPVSLQGQSGLNVAAGAAGLDLRWVR